MQPLSIPEQQSVMASSSSSRIADLMIRVLIPAIVAVLLIVLLLGEGGGANQDLQLLAPYQAAPGSTIGVRSLVLTGVRSPELTPAPLSSEADITLESEAGDVLARGELHIAPVGGAEGELTVPADAPLGDYFLVARAQLSEEERLLVRRHFTVVAEPEPSETRGHLARPTQRWELRAIEAVGAAPVPSVFEARVVGGTCVPEQVCEIAVWVGEPAASISVAASMGIEPVGDGSPETSGLARIAVTIRAAEAIVTLEARRGGELVAQRAMQLPIAMGGVSLSVEPSGLAPSTPRLTAHHLDGDVAVVVDGYHEGIWLRSRSLAAEEAGQGAPVPFELAPGLWRLTAHEEPLSASRAASHLVFVPDAGEEASAAVRRLAAHPEIARSGDPLAAGIAAGGPLPGSPDDVATFLLTLPELDEVPLPLWSSGITQANLGVDAAQGTRSWVIFALIVLGGLLVSVIVLRRGLVASEEARRLMAAAGVDDAQSASRKGKMTAYVVAATFFLLFSFAVAAALVLSRGHM